MTKYKLGLVSAFMILMVILLASFHSTSTAKEGPRTPASVKQKN